MASRGVKTAGEKKALTSAQVRESYHRRLDIHINEALDAYRSVIASCKIQDRVEGLRGDFQSQVDSSNFCKAAEDILRLISELKIASIAQDVMDTRPESRDLRTMYESEVNSTERLIANLTENILPTLEALETHYYKSCTTWPKNSTVKNDNSNLQQQQQQHQQQQEQRQQSQQPQPQPQQPQQQQQQPLPQQQQGNSIGDNMNFSFAP